jgi:hypothetical protein
MSPICMSCLKRTVSISIKNLNGGFGNFSSGHKIAGTK